MPFVANTPESLLGRSDSKDPNSTCRAITSSGRPCRRSVARASKTPSPYLRRASASDLNDEALYCWQHKDQAGYSSTQSSPGPRDRVQPILEERSSLDTLADRLGLVELHDEKASSGGKFTSSQTRPAASGRHSSGGGNGTHRAQKMTRRPKPAKTLGFCFCFTIPIEEVHDSTPPRPRPQPRPIQQQQASTPIPRSSQKHKQQQQLSPSSHHRRVVTDSQPSPSKNSHKSTKSTASATAQLKELIPDTLDMPTASALMTELARPYADSEEPGYIYMFWLTLSSQSTPPPVDAARSLLSPPCTSGGPTSAARTRRASDVVANFASQQNAALNSSGSTNSNHRKTMLLKIGRAANVQRRMNQWQRQCGYDIEVLRYYPYLPSSTDGLNSKESATTPRMTPHCRRIERLIHIELTGLGLRASDLATCGACGRDHREWFEVAASRDGIRKVDEVVRRWVDWDETKANV